MSAPRPQSVAAPEQLLRVEGLDVRYPIFGGLMLRKQAEVHAVDDLSFAIRPGETLGLVGESGCGKSTVGRALLNILWTTAPEVAIKGHAYFASERGEVDLLALEPPQAPALPQRPADDLPGSLLARSTRASPLDRSLRSRSPCTSGA